jgi:hypothetical protein
MLVTKVYPLTSKNIATNMEKIVGAIKNQLSFNIKYKLPILD